MVEEKKEKEIFFSVCSECQGAGTRALGLTCAHCRGIGVGIAVNNRLVYWGKSQKVVNIWLGRIEHGMKIFLSFIAYLIGVAGLLALGFWIFLNYRAGRVLPADYFFWQSQNILVLGFWVSLIFDMYIVYRTSEEKRKAGERKIPAAAEEEKYQDILKERGKIIKTDISKYFGPSALAVVEDAWLLADALGHDKIIVRHLFLSLLKDKKVLELLLRLGANYQVLKNKVEHELSVAPKSVYYSPSLRESNDFKKVMIEAYLEAYSIGQKEVTAVNFLAPIIRYDQLIGELLYEMEIDQEKVFNVVNWFNIQDVVHDRIFRFRTQSRFKPSSNMNRAYTAIATPILDHFGHDLTRAAKWGRLDYCVAREKEIREAFTAIDAGQLGILFVGPVGVGKRTIIHGLAELMAEENVPKVFRDKRLIEIDVARLVSGATAAQAEERLQELIDEANRSGNIVLAFNGIQSLEGITAGGEQSLDLSEVLANAIERRYIICFATASQENYVKYLEGKPLGSVMTKVEVNEPQGSQAFQIISSKINYLENRYGAAFSYNALEAAISLTAKYMHDTYLPAKAIKVMELAAAKVGKNAGKTIEMISRNDIAQVISEVTHIPISQAAGEESQKLLHLEEEIHKYMIDQVEAVDMVAASLRRARAQMTEGKRPIASFLFLGPTGVGKTELAKSIARVYFGEEKCMIRLDMSEYQLPDSVKNLIGEDGAPGYLTEAVRKAPFSLILLDEFEKAYKDILNLFLQVMDDGRLTDGQGRTVDFTNSIIIATSNAGAPFIQEALKAGATVNYDQVKETLINEHLNKVMRPELINRFDGITVFKPLDESNVIDITRLMVNNLGKRLEEKGIGLQADEAGIKILAHEGYDPKFGARPLRRLMQDKIENIIANKILAGELKRRDTVVINSKAEVEVAKGKAL